MLNASTKKDHKRLHIGSWLLFAFCCLFAVMCLLPLWMMVVNATRNTVQIRQSLAIIPSVHFIDNIKTLISKDLDLVRGFINSAIIAFSSTILSVYFSALTAYGFFMYRFRFKNVLYALVLGIIMVPGQLGMLGWYQLVVDLNMYDTYTPLIVPGIAAAGTVFFLRQYFQANFSKEIIEAARIDGSREFFSFNRIVVPIIMPALATMAIFSFIGSWNNYVGPLLILSSDELYTLPMLVQQLSTEAHKSDLGAVYAGIFVTIAPLVFFYLLFSKQIIRGVALGGVKE